ncbi:hypothetical protein CV945_05915 [Geobacillus sp. Manikaran-105]|nr:hypothetical protein CV945_05915 [Geobacillus sp. Manikaran-105]PJW17877.1 hypothetical protein CV944_06555 [Geobacillus sp. WSUCF-018B]
MRRLVMQRIAKLYDGVRQTEKHGSIAFSFLAIPHEPSESVVFHRPFRKAIILLSFHIQKRGR